MATPKRGEVWLVDIRYAAKIRPALVPSVSSEDASLMLTWYDGRNEAAMIELSEQQVEALKQAEFTPPRVVNPRTREAFVLLRVDEYERLKVEEFDDSPWTKEELQALAWERLKHEEWDEYDDLPEKP